MLVPENPDYGGNRNLLHLSSFWPPEIRLMWLFLGFTDYSMQFKFPEMVVTASLSSTSQRKECLSLFSFFAALTFHFHFLIIVSSSVSGFSGSGIYEHKVNRFHVD